MPVTVNSSPGGDEATAPAAAAKGGVNSFATGTRTAQLAHKPLALRRRRSKGTIAGFAAKASEGAKPNDASNPAASPADGVGPDGSAVGGLRDGAEPLHAPKDLSAAGSISGSVVGGGQGAPLPPGKPCHSTRLALLCVQNALWMGGRTQATLCPPGRVRRELRDALRERGQSRKLSGGGNGVGGAGSVLGAGAAGGPSSLRRPGQTRAASTAAGAATSVSGSVVGRMAQDDAFHIERVLGEAGIAEYNRLEAEFLDRLDGMEREVNSEGEDILEEKSSGDEDDLDVSAIDDEYGSPSSVVGKDKLDSPGAFVHREPLYTPVGTDPTQQQQGMAGGPSGTAVSGKIPFNHRKIRWFDAVTAQDRAEARQWLQTELANLKRRDMQRLTAHLKKMQRRERSRVRRNRNAAAGARSDDEEDDTAMEQAAIAAGVGKLPDNMTPNLSAAMVLESLSFVPLESLEGMSKCYDAIVAAGMALLDSEIDERQPSGAAGGPFSSVEKEKKPTKAEIMNALAPVLITTLEQPSGDTILALARLRNLCGTRRYQRRFVQRIAPSLVRPASAAIWCLRHQNDMEAILAATEMIFDAAFELFSPGWHEHGQTILADSQRAETLRTAADQLKKLSAAQGLPGDGLLALTSTPGAASHSHHRRGNSLFGGTPTKDGAVVGGSGPGEPLAEWEVLAVDREIRMSINNIFTRDWSRVVIANAPPRDSDSVASSQRHRRGISSNKSKSSSSVTVTASSLAAVSSSASSPAADLLLQQGDQGAVAAQQQTAAAVVASPLSPRGPHKVPLPLSPPAASSHQPPSMESLESVFGPSFATQANVAADVTLSPTAPGSPPSLSRKTGFEDGGVPGAAGAANSLTPPQTPVAQQQQQPSTNVSTPPRSPPLSAAEGAASTTPVSQQPQVNESSFMLGAPPVPMMSPGGRNAVDSSSRPSSGFGPAPLSPMSTTSAGVDIGSSSPRARADSSSSVASVATHTSSSAQAQAAQTAYLRTLTSTAAERKRTVAACRALRAQISRFEEAFIQLHGRPPKGAAERAPLATTYAQYREWKRAIRADAACRIQALFRGARVRWMLLRSNNKKLADIVLKGAGRPGYWLTSTVGGPGGVVHNSSMQNNVLGQLSIPADIGGSDSEDLSSPSYRQQQSQMQPGSTPPVMNPLQQRGSGRTVPDGSSDGSNLGVEVVITHPGGQTGPAGVNQPVPSLSPNWSSTSGLSMPKRRGGGRGEDPVSTTISYQRSEMASTGYSSSGRSSVGSSRSVGSSLTFGGVHVNELTLPELQTRKRELKQQLKQYDMNWAKQHGRMPCKAEKEPIRHLYESYNALKSRITLLEREGPRSLHESSGAPVPYRRSNSPGTSSNTSTASDNSSASGEEFPSEAAAHKSKRKEKVSPRYGEPPSAPSGSGTPSGAPPTDLAALKAEKQQLHQMLRSYEKDFFKLHNRQVSSFADIRPVASQYRRYKEIKKAIASLQQTGG